MNKLNSFFNAATLILPCSLIAPHLIYLNLHLSTRFFKNVIVVFDSVIDEYSEQILKNDFSNVEFIRSSKYDIYKVKYGLLEEYQEIEYTNLLLSGIEKSKTDIIIIQDQDDFILNKDLYIDLIIPIEKKSHHAMGLFQRTFPTGLLSLGRYSVTTSFLSFRKNDIIKNFTLIPATYAPNGDVIFDTFDQLWLNYSQSKIGFITKKENLDKLIGYMGMRHAISILLLQDKNQTPTFQTKNEIEFVLKINSSIIQNLELLKEKFLYLKTFKPYLYNLPEDSTSKLFATKLNNLLP